jgi:hypothetical protein
MDDRRQRQPAPVRAGPSICRVGQQQKPAPVCLKGDAGIPAITGRQVHENRMSRGDNARAGGACSRTSRGVNSAWRPHCRGRLHRTMIGARGGW